MRAKTRSYYETAVTDAVADIVAELDTALDLELLAGRAATSQYHFHRIFRGMVGETPLVLRRRLLLERAAWRLANTDSSVLDIAIGAGFETHEAFTRAFRSAYTTTQPSSERPGAFQSIWPPHAASTITPMGSTQHRSCSKQEKPICR